MVRRREARASFARVCTTLLWLFTCFNDLYAVKIVKIVVPEIIQYGVQDAVILDCDYNVTGNNTAGLVVKWFFRNKTRPVYQWIAAQKPQDMGILRGRVDLTYRASSDPYKMHRAMRIVKPNTDISGEYTCVVSTFMEEDQKTKQMIVFVPETNFRLIQNKTDDDTVNVICAADGAFPAPNLTLATPERRLDGVIHNLRMVNGRYSAVASVTLQDGDLPSPAEFICTLRIPQAKYAVRKEAIYYPGPISTTPEVPTAADMQLAAAVGSKGSNIYTQMSLALLPAVAYIVLS
ncbi:hypothetical protein JYU34_009818 [Plutella xylostella]|uniref:Uncharacterized protein n=2 Tax=Plutella xylostella TaxID=51655 RepID=A0ABQ7QKI2_PLUXY|nr:uncharacterized protein LOC105387158 [Plutella xylostella]KAG7305697.1 hypothetical protein JYU34_009818 [Plutella xylostella]CAG9091695.1 unnamed protein product [Plutella xylostella]